MDADLILAQYSNSLPINFDFPYPLCYHCCSYYMFCIISHTFTCSSIYCIKYDMSMTLNIIYNQSCFMSYIIHQQFSIMIITLSNQIFVEDFEVRRETFNLFYFSTCLTFFGDLHFFLT